MIRPALACTAALLLASCGAAQSPDPVAPSGPTPSDTAVLSEHIRVLSSDEFGGRGIATEGERMTIDYVTRQWEAAGFEPGGPDGGWTQDVTLRRFTMSDAEASLSVGGQMMALNQGEEIVMSTRLPDADGQVSLEGLPLVFVGYGTAAPERNWDDFEGVDVRGKIIVVLINDADFEEPGLNTFNGRAMTYYGRWTYKYEEAARQGAAGVLIVHEDAPASYGWTTVRNSWTGPQFDIERENPAGERTMLEAWITRDTAVELFRQAGLDFEALKAQARTPEFQAVEIPGATFDASYALESDTIETANIIGRLEGTTHPDETILYTAHWDHIGIGTPDANGDAIFNGAVDNATGTTALIEMARLFASGPRPERSIVLIGFTAEESGLLGSEFYAANPVYDPATTVAGFNIDGMNVIGPMVDVSVTGSGYSSLEADLARHAARQDRTVSPDSEPQAGYYFRSDHFPLAKRGIPMLYADGGTALRVGGAAAVEAASADYRANRYHQADDEWSADWDLNGMAEDIMLLYGMGLELANSRAWPTWNEGTEFRPIRDQTASRRQ
jgi:Zn-dependent M28 family amino/carboxypeptidase